MHKECTYIALTFSFHQNYCSVLIMHVRAIHIIYIRRRAIVLVSVVAAFKAKECVDVDYPRRTVLVVSSATRERGCLAGCAPQGQRPLATPARSVLVLRVTCLRLVYWNTVFFLLYFTFFYLVSTSTSTSTSTRAAVWMHF